MEKSCARAFFLGFSLWKRRFIRPFFKGENIKFTSLKKLKNINENDKIFIWGKKVDQKALEKKLKNHPSFATSPKVFFVEDGFIRSVSLGSDLTPPYSLIIDEMGLYVDAKRQSKLEFILQNTNFSPALLKRAAKLIELLKQNKLSKYNGLKHEKLDFRKPREFLGLNLKESSNPNSNKSQDLAQNPPQNTPPKMARKDQKIILIPAQVEDDISMILGGFNLSTEKFIKKVRELNKDAFIVFKPHPDVLSGNRKGLKDSKIILKYCDEIVTNCSIDSVILASDEVHTITSTAGFDALIRSKKVVTYGLPFYAGWGLTQDFKKCPRRSVKLSLEALVAGALIMYPKYINPNSKNLCEIEESLDIILKMQERYFNDSFFKTRTNLRNLALRKLRRAYERGLCVAKKLQGGGDCKN